MYIHFVLLLCLLSVVNGWSDNRQRRFKDDFLFGVGTAAYQVEGAWNEDGKGESIWDRYFHEHPEVIVDGRNGDEAADSYHQLLRDVEMLRELGVDFYRFSISWPRVLPKGIGSINEKGLQYYSTLVDELLKHNIQPMVTIHHFDLPQDLQDKGGWLHPSSPDWFRDYSEILFKRFADKVKFWVTINQPNSICFDGYGDTQMPPALGESGAADYRCVKNVMLAHAKAYRLYEKKYKKQFGGDVGIALCTNWADPINNQTENVKAAEEFREFSIGLYMNPIWSKNGDFPEVVKKIVGRKSREQGLSESRLPKLSADEIQLLKGSADFLGMNHYTTQLVKRATTKADAPSFADDIAVELSQSSQWRDSKSEWLKSAPYGIYKSSLHINKVYDYPPVFITEHGWSTGPGLGDQSRVDTMREYLSALLLAVEDGTRVRGYSAWSLMDNIEWTAGISERFGLYEVDFESPNKTRTPRLSAFTFKRIIQSRVIENDWTPKKLQMTISDRNKNKNKEKGEL